MYADYMKEKFNIETIETESGFMQYLEMQDGESLLMYGVYTKPEWRNRNGARWLQTELEQRARKLGKNKIYAEVILNNRNVEEGLLVALHGGYKIHAANQQVITLVKFLGEVTNG